MTPPPDPPAPTILTYDAYTPAKDKRSRWITLGYCLGMLLVAVPFAIVQLFATRHEEGYTLDWLMTGIGISLIIALLASLLAVVSLRLIVWIKQKWLNDVRCSRFRAAVLWGVGGGLYPWPFFRYFHLSGDSLTWIFLGAALWYLLFPAIAGAFLCYRSHLRE